MPLHCSPGEPSLTHRAPPSIVRSPAGQGSALSQEVDQLKKMLKTGADWEVISQMMSYISDKAAQVDTLTSGGGPGGPGAGASTSRPAAAGAMLSSALGRLGRAPLGGGSPSKQARAKLQRLGLNISEVRAARCRAAGRGRLPCCRWDVPRRLRGSWAPPRGAPPIRPPSLLRPGGRPAGRAHAAAAAAVCGRARGRPARRGLRRQRLLLAQGPPATAGPPPERRPSATL